MVTGSHGGLLGGRPETPRAAVFAALYNDADGGIDGAGFTRLPALDARGIAVATYSVWTAYRRWPFGRRDARLQRRLRVLSG